MKKLTIIIAVFSISLITLAGCNQDKTELGWTNANDSTQADIQDIRWSADSTGTNPDQTWNSTTPLKYQDQSELKEVNETSGYVSAQYYDDTQGDFADADVSVNGGGNSLTIDEGSSNRYDIVAETAKK